MPSTSRQVMAGHRIEIDGLRAFAVVPVILNHAGFALFGGGFAGVDVFFVISGFLIAGILRDELNAGTFSIAGFYERRVRRILPALFVVSLACIPFACYLMLPGDLRNFGQSLIAVNVFLANVHFLHENGYAEQASEYKPLLHTWSLAVEEQFYLIFPLALWGLFKYAKRYCFVILFGIALISLLIAEIGSRYDPNANFYLLPGRAWELLAGVLLALSGFDRDSLSLKKPWMFQVLSLVGLVLICGSVVFCSSVTAWPGVFTLLPVGGALLVIACATRDTIAYRILSCPPVVGIGVISYSAYLWHQPLFAFSRLYLTTPVPQMYIVLIGVTFALAYLSWRFVEAPFRNRAILKRPQMLGGLLAFSILLISVGGLFHFSHGLPWRFTGEAETIASGARDASPYWGECDARNPVSFENFCLFGDSSTRTVAIIGDSHSMEIFWKMTDGLGNRPYALQAFSWHGCPPFADPTGEVSKGCRLFRKRTKSYILGQATIDTVVIVANLPSYFNCARDGTCITSIEQMKMSSVYDARKHETRVAELLNRDIDAYISAGKKVVIMYPIPQMDWDVPRYMLSRLRMSRSVDSAMISLAEHETRTQLSRAFIAQEVSKKAVVTMDPVAILCSGGSCKGEIDGVPLYYDGGHLNGKGASLLAPPLLTILDHMGGRALAYERTPELSRP